MSAPYQKLLETGPLSSSDIIDRLNRHHPKVIDLSLERVERLLGNLKNPEKKLSPVIHVAGTNGKGSVIAFMRSFAEAAGLKVHVYTSPHLVDFKERIRVAGELITDAALGELLDECEVVNKGLPITFFEITTALAFLAFSRTPADLCLLETGLGGRLDATNVLDQPAVTALTPISYDHMGFLGADLNSIAAEKAAIMRRHVPAVVSAQKPVADVVIREASKNIGSHLLVQGSEWRMEPSAKAIRIETPHRSLIVPMPGLTGRHQIQNAAQALTCLDAWRPGVIPDIAVVDGLRAVRWPGRLQRLSSGPLVDRISEGWELWLDGGHNPAAGEVLAAQAVEWCDKPLFGIWGMISSKDPDAFIAPLLSHMAALRTVAIPGEAASINPAALAGIAGRHGGNVQSASSLQRAIDDLVGFSGTPGRILICGSLYLAGEVLRENV